MTLASKFLDVQNELNLKLSPEWATKGWAYTDAMFTEATEAYNHLNWEWWRATDRKIDWDQVKLEWVDVGHFLFSEIIVHDKQSDFNILLEEYAGDYDSNPPPNVMDDLSFLKSDIKRFIQAVLRHDLIRTPTNLYHAMAEYLTVLWDLRLSVTDLYTLFISKVCLNQLRWKNGYKKGIYGADPSTTKEHYIKTWDGQEDNVWLSAYAATLDPLASDYKLKIEQALDAKYKEVYDAIWNK